MILLSALLASLTGLVAGERQPVRAQVELSTAAIVGQAETVAARSGVSAAPAEPARSGPRRPAGLLAVLLLVLTVGAFLSRKQSWLA
jgi:hypothetical protein